jgi:hypothetical protein
MQIRVVTDVGVDRLVPPRCRKPRYGSIRSEVTCHLVEIASAAVDLAARTTSREGGETVERDHYFEPEAGFLIRCDHTVEQLAQSIARPGYGDAVPEGEVPGQGRMEITLRRREVEERIAEFVVSEKSTVYQKVAEPCYRVRYSPSFNWSAGDLLVREAPYFTSTHYREERGWFRLFSATQLREAKRLQEALRIAGGDQVTGSDDDRIEVFSPEAFTFDAALWHAERERYLVKEKFDELVEDLRRVTGIEDSAFCPERRILAEWIEDARPPRLTERLRDEAETRLNDWLQSVAEGGTDGDVVPAVR